MNAPVRLLDHKAGQCRFPVEGEGADLLYCGRGAVHGSYCPEHRKVAYGRGTPSERSAHRVLKAHMVGAVVIGLVAPAHAQTVCADTKTMFAGLAKTYGEAPIGAGVTKAGELVTLLASPDGRTWTLLVTKPGGLTCALGSGEGWEKAAPKPVGEPG
jgi:hypothetical protein